MSSKFVKAADSFDLSEMHSDLMIYGMHVYHEPLMKDLVDFDSTKWNLVEHQSYGISSCHSAAEKLKNIQMKQVFPLFPNLIPMQPFVYYGIDEGSRTWHNDSREKLGIQFFCYQEDFEPADGGSLQVRCYDGIERRYYPKNGDIVVMNHHTDIFHMVEQISGSKKRLAINFSLKRP